jgi:hypothetical protein
MQPRRILLSFLSTCLTATTAAAFEPQFDTRLDYHVTTNPQSVCAADFDGDGEPDLAVANYDAGSSSVSILKNEGSGTFSDAVSYGVEAGPRSVIAADFDGDGKPDLAVANWSSNSVSVLKNNGDGTFASAVNYLVGNSPMSVYAADFDGDSWPDLAVANYNSNTVSILRNNGTGAFASSVNYGVGISPQSVCSADLDGDGKADVAVANGGSANVSVLGNNGNGTFAGAVNYGAGNNPWSVVAADLDGDGRPDLAVANIASNTLSILKNNGNGTFAGAVNYGPINSPRSAFAADFDGDGALDIAVANSSSSSVSILSNNGNGTFGAAVYYGVGQNPYSVFAADFDGDGSLDLAAANYNSYSVSILTNAGDGTLVAPANYGVGSYPYSGAPADLDGDGDVDIAVANTNSGTVSILRNDDNGTFAGAVDYAVGIGPRSVAAADFNFDGKPDLAVANSVSDNVTILINDGDATFAAGLTYGVGNGPVSIAAIDLDGDFRPDLAVVDNQSNTISVLHNNGDGTFAAAVDYAVGSSPISVVAADFDGTGPADLAVASYVANSVSVLKNNGDGTFATPVAYIVGDNPHSLCAVDVNGDGLADLAVANFMSNSVSVMQNIGNGVFSVALDYAVGQRPVSVSSADFDGDDNSDLAVSNLSANSVSLLSNDGAGTFAAAVNYGSGSGPISVVAADFNSDGSPDLATVNADSNEVSIILNKESFLTGCGTTVFADDFADGDMNGWHGNVDQGTWAAVGGALDLTLATPESISWRFTGNNGWSDYCLGFDFNNITGIDKLVYLRWGTTAGADGYLVSIRSNYGGFTQSDISVRKYIDNTVVESFTYPVATQSSQWYHVDLTLEGNVIKMWLDGAQVFTYTDAQNLYPTGYFGFAAQKPYGVGQSHVQFDNVEVRCGTVASCEPFCNASGRVVRAGDGLPLRDVLVEFTQGGAVRYVSTSGADGEYALQGIDTGTFYIRYSCPGYAPLVNSAVLEPLTNELAQVALNPLTTVSGRVSQAKLTPVPIAGASVEFRKDGNVVASAATSEDGSYLVVVPSGAYEIEVSKDGYQPLSFPRLDAPIGGTSRDFELLTNEYANLAITLTFRKEMLEENATCATDSFYFLVRLVNSTRELRDVDLSLMIDGTRIPWDLTSYDQNGDGLLDLLGVGTFNFRDSVKISTPWNQKEIGVQITSVEGWKVTRLIQKQVSVSYLFNGAPFRMYVDGYSFVNPDLGWRSEDGLLRNWFNQTDKSLGRYIGFVVGSLSLARGACLGMAASSNAYFITSAEKPVQGITYSMTLSMPEVANRIVEYHLGARKRLYQTYLSPQSATEFGAAVKNAIEGQRTLVVGLSCGLSCGHAVSAYKSLFDHTANTQYVTIYDNERPYPSRPDFIAIDHNAGSFVGYFAEDYQYFRAFENVTRLTVDEIVADLWGEIRGLPGKLLQGSKRMLHIGCPVHPLIVNSAGQRLGFTDDSTWTDEIPTAEYFVTPTGSGDSSYLFYIPTGQDYVVTCDATATGLADVLFFTPRDETSGVSSVIDQVSLSPGSQIYLEVSDSAAAVDSVILRTEGDGVFDSVYRAVHNLSPGSARLLSPTSGSATMRDTIAVAWTAAVDLDYADTVSYKLILSLDSTLHTAESVFVGSDTFAVIRLDSAGRYYWCVQAIDTRGSSTISSDTNLINYQEFVCGDANSDLRITASDIIFLVTYTFRGGPAPIPIEAGDPTCDARINAADVIYLVNFVFKSGPEPCCR